MIYYSIIMFFSHSNHHHIIIYSSILVLWCRLIYSWSCDQDEVYFLSVAWETFLPWPRVSSGVALDDLRCALIRGRSTILDARVFTSCGGIWEIFLCKQASSSSWGCLIRTSVSIVISLSKSCIFNDTIYHTSNAWTQHEYTIPERSIRVPKRCASSLVVGLVMMVHCRLWLLEHPSLMWFPFCSSWQPWIQWAHWIPRGSWSLLWEGPADPVFVCCHATLGDTQQRQPCIQYHQICNL